MTRTPRRRARLMARTSDLLVSWLPTRYELWDLCVLVGCEELAPLFLDTAVEQALTS